MPTAPASTHPPRALVVAPGAESLIIVGYIAWRLYSMYSDDKRDTLRSADAAARRQMGMPPGGGYQQPANQARGPPLAGYNSYQQGGYQQGGGPQRAPQPNLYYANAA